MTDETELSAEDELLQYLQDKGKEEEKVEEPAPEPEPEPAKEEVVEDADPFETPAPAIPENTDDLELDDYQASTLKGWVARQTVVDAIIQQVNEDAPDLPRNYVMGLKHDLMTGNITLAQLYNAYNTRYVALNALGYMTKMQQGQKKAAVGPNKVTPTNAPEEATYSTQEEEGIARFAEAVGMSVKEAKEYLKK